MVSGVQFTPTARTSRWRSWINALVCKTNIRQFEPDSGLNFMPLWGNWLDPVDLGSAVEIHMKVRILPGAQTYRGVSPLSDKELKE